MFINGVKTMSHYISKNKKCLLTCAPEKVCPCWFLFLMLHELCLEEFRLIKRCRQQINLSSLKALSLCYVNVSHSNIWFLGVIFVEVWWINVDGFKEWKYLVPSQDKTGWRTHNNERVWDATLLRHIELHATMKKITYILHLNPNNYWMPFFIIN